MQAYCHFANWLCIDLDLVKFKLTPTVKLGYASTLWTICVARWKTQIPSLIEWHLVNSKCVNFIAFRIVVAERVLY